jgi:peptidoglycan/LPS O-acetylase OafA/YrhL
VADRSLSPRLLVPILFIILVLSLSLSVWAADAKPSAGFYLAPTRAWELLIGAILAVTALPATRSVLAGSLGAVGVMLIAYAVSAFSATTPFPGSAAWYLWSERLLSFTAGEPRTHSYDASSVPVRSWQSG